MLFRQRSKHVVLAVTLSLIAALAWGCGRDKTGGGGSGQGGTPQADAQIDGVAWQPFALKPGDYFKYEVVDHPVKKKGWVSVEVADKGEGQIELRFQGEREDGMKMSQTVVEKPDMLMIMSRAQLSTLPVATPFLGTVLLEWWEKFAGFEMKLGAQWTVVFGEMVPAGFIAKTEGYCTVAGHKGFQTRLTLAKTDLSETCISPRVPLPLQVRVNDSDNKARYESRLVEYRVGKE